MRIVVVGAGVGGLAVALALVERGEGDVLLLEGADRPGGRVRTVYEEGAAVSYEAGPWRIPASHRRAGALFRKHGVALVPGTSRTFAEEGEEVAGNPDPVRSGLTTWDVRALARGAAAADRLDLATGYADQSHSASGSDPYLAPGEECFRVAPAGFSALVEAMAARLGPARLRLDARVVDLRREGRGRYRLFVRRRRGHNAFVDEEEAADAVFVCVPPHRWRDWTCLRADARSVASAVEEGVLHHIYVASDACLAGGHAVDPERLGQVVPSQYDGSCWWQISYSSGRLARMWHRYALADADGFLARLGTAVRRWTGGGALRGVRRHFWPFAYHKWRAVPSFDLERAVAEAIRPNPVRLPRLYCAGEAFSSHQAWIEGALETAEMALEAWEADGAAAPSAAAPAAPPPTRWRVYVEGRPIDVSRFRDVHPGSEAALAAHLGEEVDELMEHIGHSADAWATVHSLKDPMP